MPSIHALGFDPDRLDNIDIWMQRNLDIGRFAGSSALIARHGDIAHLSSVGKRSLEDDLPFETDTIARIYSMTKMVTSVGLMMLVERGLLHLEAPVSRFLPEFTTCQALVAGAVRPDQVESASSPTIGQLLTHTSGLTYGFNEGLLPQLYTENAVSFDPAAGGLDIAVKRLSDMPLAFQPGTKWEYSVGIDVIGRVIEVVSGQSFDDFLQQHIFDPLDMKDTSFMLSSDKTNRFADCYAWTEKQSLMRVDSALSSEFGVGKVDTISGGGGLLSTLQDYFHFGEMIRRGGVSKDGHRLLSPRTLAFMRGNHLPGDIASMGPTSFAEMPMHGMGFGIGGASVLDPVRVGMPSSPGDYGWGGMASTYFWTDPVEQLTCIFFTQLIPSSAYPNRAEFKALVHAALID